MKYVLLAILMVLVLYFVSMKEGALNGAFIVAIIGLVICISLIEFCKWIDRKAQQNE